MLDDRAIVRDMDKPSVGRIVHYVLDGGRYPGECRAAIIVRLWPNTDTVQMQVFPDGANDYTEGTNVLWKTSVAFSEDEHKPATWHWPERV